MRLLSFLLMFLPLCCCAQREFSMPLWESLPAASPSTAASATVRVYLPAEARATGRAVVICPGGGYAKVWAEGEGEPFARLFQSMGVAAIVLNYRLPAGDAAIPVGDAAEALRLAWRHGQEWHIHPADIGIMGASAGGHLAATIATQGTATARDAAEARAKAADQKLVPRPAFQILLYPVITMLRDLTHRGSHDRLLGPKAKAKQEKLYSADMHVSRLTPPAYITLAADDAAVSPLHGLNYYRELYRHDVPASLFVFPQGGHGWGGQPGFAFHSQLFASLRAWLRSF